MIGVAVAGKSKKGSDDMKFWKKIQWEWANRYWHNTRQKRRARCEAYARVDKSGWAGRDAYDSILYAKGEKVRRVKR